MRYYKLVKNFKNYTFYKEGEKYAEDFRFSHLTLPVHILVEKYPEDWQEVK